MPKKKSTSSDSFRLADGLVSALCLAGALACLAFFYFDLSHTLSRLGEQPVGTITWKHKAAQRRFIDRVLWDRLQMESPVYNGDSIRTAALSEAFITFSGDGSTELAENSLVRIFAGDLFPGVELFEGNLSVDAGKDGVSLISGGHELFLHPGGSADAFAADGGVEFQVTGGRALLVSAGYSRELTAGEAVGFGPDGRVDESSARAVVLAPLSNARLLSPGPLSLMVEFVWNRINYSPADFTRIDIAYDRGFTRLAASLDVPGDQDHALVGLPPGVYFRRVRVLNGSSTSGPLVSPSSGLTILYASPPVLLSPAEGRSYPYHAGARPPQFRWAPSGTSGIEQNRAAPDYYLLEAADNPEMENPVLRLRTRGTQTRSPLPSPGRWFWRVSAWYGETPRISEQGSFTLGADAELSRPVLNAPAPESGVDISPERQNLYFSWRVVNGAASYTIAISPNEDLSDPVITQSTGENYYAYPVESQTLREGRYYWAVSAFSDNGTGSSSLSRSFTVLGAQPAIRAVFPPDNYTVADDMLEDMRFTWKSSLAPVRFQIADDPGFTAPVLDEETENESFQGRRLDAGTWYWRVSALSEPLSSAPRSLTVAGALPPPLLSGETQGGHMMVRRGEDAVFRWQPVEGADYYQFCLYGAEESPFAGDESPPLTALLSEQIITDTSVGIAMDAYPEGNYRWTVQAFASQSRQSSRRSGRVDEALFYLSWTPEPGRPRIVQASVQSQSSSQTTQSRQAAQSSQITQSQNRQTIAPPLAPPELVSPGNGYTFGAAQFRNSSSITFNWSALDEAADYTFMLFAEDGRRLVNVTVSHPPYILEDLSILARGAFTWRVQANLENGASSPQAEHKFIVDIPAVRQSRLQDMGTVYGTE
ncbi:MAG: hypothetical protein LBH73_08255 [Spirochaetaceae bacterium]|jgi:hypothetical protein|nr:hypothetical protein [Spirochaetaceae bacterium]